MDCNKTENNKTEVSKTYPIQSYPEAGSEEPETKTRMGWDMDGMDDVVLYRELVKRNIEYNVLVQRNEPERVDEILELIVDTVCSAETITISSDDYPKEVVKSRFQSWIPAILNMCSPVSTTTIPKCGTSVNTCWLRCITHRPIPMPTIARK